MNFSDWIEVLAAAITALLLVAAATTDISRYRIPNAIVYAIVAAFFVGVAFNLSWPAIAWSILAGVGMFLLGAGLFAAGLFGGGDVKLVAAMALWTGLADLPRFLLVMTATGGLLGLVWIVKRRYHHSTLANEMTLSDDASISGTPPVETSSASKAPNRIPYGVAIAVAGLDFFVTSGHSPFAPLLPWIA